MPSVGRVEQNGTITRYIERPIAPPLRVEAGDTIWITQDGSMLGRYGSDGHLIETRMLR